MKNARRRSYLNFDYRLYERGTGDPEKAKSASIFHERWKQAEAEPRYAARKLAWRAHYG